MLSLDMVRGGRSGFAGAFVALFLGVALVSMTALVFASAGPRVPARYAGTAVLVRAPAAVQADGSFLADRPWPPETVRLLTDRLKAVPGVVAAVPDRSFYAQPVIGGRPDPGRLEGRPWSSAALAPHRLVSGSPPSGDREVVVEHALGLAPGSAVTLLTAAGPVPYAVSGTADGPGLYLGDAAAARLSGGVRVIGLRTAPGADLAAVEAAARTATGNLGEVLSGGARTALETKADARTRWIGTQVLTAMASLSGFAVVFVVASTFAFGVMRRRRDLGLLRAVGATPRQVRRMVRGEALAVGVAAALAGVAAGIVLAPVFGDLLVTAGFEPSGFSVRITAWPPAAAFGGGLVVALLGTWTAARRAARTSPLEALREAGADRRPMTRARLLLGSAFTAAGIAVAVAVAGTRPEETVTLALLAAMALTVGIALLAPAVLPPVVRALLWPPSRARGPPGRWCGRARWPRSAAPRRRPRRSCSPWASPYWSPAWCRRRRARSRWAAPRSCGRRRWWCPPTASRACRTPWSPRPEARRAASPETRRTVARGVRRAASRCPPRSIPTACRPRRPWGPPRGRRAAPAVPRVPERTPRARRAGRGRRGSPGGPRGLRRPRDRGRRPVGRGGARLAGGRHDPADLRGRPRRVAAGGGRGR
ncbi:ABC transporter permease [Streptosporangium sandarakinum]|uniref:ABC transporter permease n=1 Tax=Streptosporangium sandarakinum TaxID=1260955 RepID=UPI003D94ADDE